MKETPRKIDKLLELINQDIASPRDVVNAVELLVELMTRTDKKLGLKIEKAFEDASVELKRLSKKTDGDLELRDKYVSKVKTELSSLIGSLGDKLNREIKLLRSEVPVIDNSDLEARIDAIIIPEIEDIENELPKLGDRIRDGLELLNGDERLDKSAVKGLDDYDEVSRLAREPKVSQTTGAFGIKEIIAGSNITVDNTNLGYPVVSASGGVISDELVKYDASDPTAGYLSAKVVAGTGISLSEGTGADENKLKITNSAPDQTVAITAGTNITSVTGTYPNFTINAATQGSSYTLPTATDTVLGGIKVGTTLGIVAGVLDYTNPNPTPYSLPTAAAGTLGGIKVGTGLSIDGSGVLSATAGGSGTVTSVAALTLGTTGTDLSSTVADGTTTPVITLQVPTASATNRGALSSADWSTFSAKIGANDIIDGGTWA